MSDRMRSPDLDLRGIRCPLTWARARVSLEVRSPGEIVVLLVDDPRSVRDLPRAAEACGYQVTEVAPDAAGWRITIEV